VKIINLLFIVIAILIVPCNAFAYVDPSIFAYMYQVLFVAGFAAINLFLFRPWNYFKNFFKRKKINSDSLKKS